MLSRKKIMVPLLLLISIAVGIPYALHSSAQDGDEKPETHLLETSPPVPIFNSFLGAPTTVFLDFDGSPDGRWPYSGLREHRHDDDPRSFSEEELQDIEAIWNCVAEQFRPFRVNVTTDQRLYDVAAEDDSPRTIVYINPGHRGASWSSSWIYKPGGGTCSIAANSTVNGICKSTQHELAHSVGLDHDITPRTQIPNSSLTHSPMFNGTRGITQWSKGETLVSDFARRQRDPIEIITSERNRTGYRADDHGNVHRTASLLPPGTTDWAGIIERKTDVDVFRLTTTGGPLTIDIRPEGGVTVRLDVLAELYDSNGRRLLVSDPKGDELGAQLQTPDNTPAGTYFVHISGTGQGTPGHDGYSDYGSIGAYHIEAEYSASANQQDVVHGLVVQRGGPRDSFTQRQSGLIQLPGDSLYAFYAGVKCAVAVDNQLVVEHDGSGGLRSGLIRLSAGLHTIQVDYFDAAADGEQHILYSGKGIVLRTIPDVVLYPAPDTPLAPVASDDVYTVVNHEFRVESHGGVLFNDYDYNGDRLEATLVRDVRRGELTLNQDGSFVYTPAADLRGGEVDEFTYRISDGTRDSEVATVRFTVWGPHVDFRDFQLINYNGPGLPYGAQIEDDGNTLRLTASDWSKKILLPYTITENTVLAFDFNANPGGNYYQIGLMDNSIGFDPMKLIRLAGAYTRGAQRFGGMGDIVNYQKGPGSYVIPVGQHYIGSMQSLCFGNVSQFSGLESGNPNPEDPQATVALSTFSNVRIYEASDPEFSFTPVEEALAAPSAPDQITLVRHLNDALADAYYKDNKVRLSLWGLFTGAYDDWKLQFEIIENSNEAQVKTKVGMSNSGSTLTLELPETETARARIVLRISDGEKSLDYPFELTWSPETAELEIRAAR